jgi:glucose/mannose-6-phosphate isomerase
MLDDLQFIHQRDSQDALGVANKEWQQLQYDFQSDWHPSGSIDAVIVTGMGGSALAATVAQTWLNPKVSYEVVRNYNLPDYASHQALVVASSYSGNTEETLSALSDAEDRGCQIVIVASGGELADIAQQKQYPLFRLPTGLQPRMAVFYNLAALTKLFVLANICQAERIAELHAAGEWLRDQSAKWYVDVPAGTNTAKSIAQELIGKSIVIYSGPKLYPAAYKWKISFNESAKHIAWVNQLPEFNHNEMLGWTEQPVDKPYVVIDLRSSLEHDRIQKRFTVTEQLLSGMRPEPIVVPVVGETILEQLVWAITLGDFVSLYTALLGNIDPTPVDLIEKFKKTLAQ